jgi:hypothetical protein
MTAPVFSEADDDAPQPVAKIEHCSEKTMALLPTVIIMQQGNCTLDIRCYRVTGASNHL